MPHILVADKIAEGGLEALKRADDITFDVKHGLSPEQLASTIGKYDGILIRSAVKLPREVFANPGKLTVVARAGVGVDNVDLEAATQAGVLVLNTPDANTISTAEHSFALILALHRRIPSAHQHVTSGQWKRGDFQGGQLAGSTLGIVGFGRIGRAMAQRALAFEMDVIAFDPFVSGPSALDGAVPMTATLDDLLAKSDCVTLHAALSSESRHMIGAEQLAKMKPGAKIINCARGALIDEQALADALNEGHLGGAAIDVYENEPPEASPLLTARNIVLTPHLAASTAEAQRRVSVDAANALLAYLLRGEIQSAVNVAGMPKSVSPRHRAFVDLCSRMGSILSTWAHDGVQKISATIHGESLSELGSTLALQSMASVIGPHLDTRLNLVNASEQAKRRGIVVEHAVTPVRPDRTEFVRIAVQTRDGEHTMEGTVFVDGSPRILAIDDYRMEMVPERTVVLIFNDDRPGVIGTVGQMVGDAEINIADMALSRKNSKALMVLKLDMPLPDELRNALRALSPPIYSVHSVTLPAMKRS